MGRRSLAELLAHLGEVEERRIHLAAGYGSMFEYCVKHLGLSEDEACRRIEVARLARRYPAIFAMLAEGQLSMSVAALLKPYLDAGNASRLLATVATCSTVRAREVLAAWFPRPDVPTSVRKLPQPRSVPAPATAPMPPPLPQAQPSLSVASDPSSPPAPPPPVAPPPVELRLSAPARIEPLAPARYKVQLTASAELKGKLELARDLLRHAVPSGDYATILERALDLLIADVKKSRFGATSRPRSAGEVAAAVPQDELGSAMDQVPDDRASCVIPRATRRIVAERDELRCSWVNEDGQRCGARAWLEYDHRWPRGKGGPTTPDYLRLVCRAHNRFEAERAYGRGTVERAIQRARTRDAPAGDAGGDDPNGSGFRQV